MGKAWLFGTSAVCLGLGLGVLIYARRDRTSPPKVPPPIVQATVGVPARKPAEVVVPHDFLGVIVTPQAVDITARLEGRVADMHVRIGDRVAKDAPLATLDVRVQRSDLVVAEAALKAAVAAENRARIELAQAHDKMERSTKLTNVISAEELATARYAEKLAGSALESGRANVTQAEARVKQLEIELAEGVVRAPFEGVVASTYTSVGAVVHAQSPIARLISGDKMWVRFAVPEEQARTLSHGVLVRVNVATLATGFDGEIESVAPEVDPAARMVFAEAKLTIPDEWKTRVPVGAVARVALTIVKN